jgi:ATP-binding cassette, subfamily F, member 3
MLCINNLLKTINGRVLLNNLNYNFPNSGIVALIGVNGAGKTTFLNILCGLDEADKCSVNKAKSKTLGYLPQDPHPHPKDTILEECMSGNFKLFDIHLDLKKAEDAMTQDYSHEKYEEFEKLENLYRQNNGYSFEADAAKILAGLGIGEEILNDHPSTLSGGWRMRLELAKLLLQSPDFLILDEPTNHLDLPAIMWLENYLQKFKGTILFVSHDLDLLNRLPSNILHLKDGNITEYTGNYDDYVEQYQLRQEGKIAELKAMEKKISSASKFVERFKAKASKAAQARSRMKMIGRMQNEVSGINVDNADMEINIKIPLTQKSGANVLQLENCAIGYDKPLMQNMSVVINRGKKVAIVGGNGLGKSTFIKTIVGEIPFLGGNFTLGHNVKIAYYAQDQHEYLDLDKTVLENLQRANHLMIESKARKLLGSFLFRGDDVFKRVGVLSGGEKSRLSLACLLIQDANLLLLDEPTNHLDMLSVGILTEALSHYEGTVLFVSHNRNFINGLATHIYAFNHKHEAILYEGNLDDLEESALA